MDEEPESRRKPFEMQCFKDRQAACSKILVFIRAKKQHRTIKRSSRKTIPVSFALLHADLFMHSHHLKRQSSWKTRVLERVALERTIKRCWSRTIQHFRWSRRPFWK